MIVRNSGINITINVPLILKVQDIILFRLQNIHIMGISRGFSRGPRPFLPLNCPERSEGLFWGKKG
jgi:hypothetical protein